MIKLRTLRWEDYPGLSWWAQCNHKGPYMSIRGGHASVRVTEDDTTWKQERVGWGKAGLEVWPKPRF